MSRQVHARHLIHECSGTQDKTREGRMWLIKGSGGWLPDEAPT